jgi:carbon-monoxide dehydrogenase small subunit
MRAGSLEVLRGLGPTGTKEGRSNGNCGACNAILDGVLVNSCLKAGEIDGRKVTTIEGRRADGLPVQRKFLEHAALQCGFWHAWFPRGIKALLDAIPQPSEQKSANGWRNPAAALIR